jgi:hypothetical protein
VKTSTQQRGRVAESTWEKGAGARSSSLLELLVNKGWKGRKVNSRWVISHCLKKGR